MASVRFSCLRRDTRLMVFASLRSNGKVAEFAFLCFPLGSIRDEAWAGRFSHGLSHSTSGGRPEPEGDVWSRETSWAVEEWDVIRYTGNYRYVLKFLLFPVHYQNICGQKCIRNRPIGCISFFGGCH